jgi:surfeit locus 1 family protein
MLLKKLNSNPKLALFSGFFFIAFLILAFWQATKGIEKERLETKFEESLRLEPKPLTDISKQWDSITLEGSFDFSKEILIDNKIYSGKKGYTVLTPFTPEDKKFFTFLVDRGWAQHPYFPSGASNKIKEAIRGVMYIPEKNFVVGKNLASENWPRVVQQKDILFLESIFGSKLEAHLIKLEPANPNTLVYVSLIPSKISSSKHFGYAFQWLLMAVVLAFVFIKFINNKDYEQ